LAEEQLNLFEEPIRGRLMFLKYVILALKGDEAGTGNAGSQLTAGLEWNHLITPHMHN
jgi:hypothetical protein